MENVAKATTEEAEVLEDNIESSDENESDYDSQHSEEDGSEFDSPLKSPSSGSGPSDSSLENDDIIDFENLSQHESFFQLARQLRDTSYRPPGLQSKGRHKTQFWADYGVEPTEPLPLGNLHGIDTMFTDDEFKKLCPAERRIHVNGQKFKIVPTQAPTKTLYRAIANALSMYEEDSYKLVWRAIYDEILDNWQLYSSELCQFCGLGEEHSYIDPETCEPRAVLETYKKMTYKQSEPPLELELLAAAMHFGFNYSIMELESLEGPVLVRNCANEAVIKNGTVKYNFLRSRFDSYIICHEFLLPIGPLKKIKDGPYPAILRDVILIERYRPGQASTMTISENLKNRPLQGPIPVGFGLDHRTFFHRSTITHDLWSLLAELLYGKLIHAPRIKRKVVDSKHNFSLYYLASKAQKRYQVKGNPGVQRLVNEFNKRFSKENVRGGVEDLMQAAAYYDFSYTIIGMDYKGNFHWTDRVSQEDNSPYLAFFAKTAPDKKTFWYALEDIGRYCPKERKLYKDVQAGDLRAWRGRFYFNYLPKKNPTEKVKIKKLTSKAPSPSPTQRIIGASTHAFRWASIGMAKMRSSITVLYSKSFRRAKSFYQRVMEFLQWLLRSRRRVSPDKKVQELFVRDQP